MNVCIYIYIYTHTWIHVYDGETESVHLCVFVCQGALPLTHSMYGDLFAMHDLLSVFDASCCCNCDIVPPPPPPPPPRGGGV